MNSPIPPTSISDKLVSPVIKGVITRQRLFDLLHAAGKNYRLIWFQAPAGAGKTSLAASYIQQSICPSLWYRFDENDNDPADFFQNFQAAVQINFGVGFPTAAYNPGYINNLAAFSRQFFNAALINDNTQRLIVLDDFQAVQQNENLQIILETLFKVCPKHFQLLIFSRNPPPAHCLTLLYNELTVVPAQTLTFNEQETTELLASKAIHLTDDQLKNFIEETRGWAAALSIFANHIEANSTQAGLNLKHLALQAWEGLSEQFKRHLLCIFLPYTLTETVAIALTGETSVRETLFTLSEEQYLLSRIDSQPTIYKLHPLLRQFLTEQLQKQIGTEDLRLRITEVAEILEHHAQVNEAADLYVQAEDWPKLSHLILNHAKTELEGGRAIRLLNWLNQLPDYAFNTPWLGYWKAVATLPLSPKSAQGIFHQVHTEFGSDPLGRLLSAAGVVTAMYFAWDEFTQAPFWLAELAELDDFRASLNDPELDTWVLGCGNMLVNIDANPLLLRGWIERAEYLIQAHPRSDQLFLFNFLLQARIWRGDFSGCRALLMHLNQEQAPPIPLQQVTVLIWSAVSAFLEADHQKAYQATEQAKTIAESYDLRFLLPQIYGQEIYTALSCHDLDRAAKALQNMNGSLLAERRQDLGFYLHVKSCWLLLKDELSQARKEAEATLNISLQTGVASSAVLVEHVLAQILILQSDWNQATIHLDRVDGYCQKAGFTYIYFMSQLTRANGLLLIGDETAAAEVLKKALIIGRTHRYVNAHPQWQPENMTKLCTLALEQNIESQYIRTLIRERNLKPDQHASESWPWPVKIRTLGSFRVDAAEQALQPGKKDNKPLLLLQLLITLNPDGVARQVLADQIWPDADADTALHALEVNLQRLRKMLGRADAIILSGGNLYLNRNLCWLDVWTLDDLIRRLDQQLIATETVVQRLMTIWRGPFLPGQNASDTVAKRLSLSAKFIRVMTQIVQTLIQENKPESAIQAIRKAIEVEPLAEHLHHQLIKVLLDQGRPLEALAAYQLYESIHHNHLGHQPSETLSSCQTLLKNANNR